MTRYVHTGPQWIEVLETIAHDWPRPLWEDLRQVASTRLSPTDEVYSHLRPWSDWTGSEPIKTPLRPPRPLRDRPTDELLAQVRTGSVPALRELNFRGPHPELLSFVDEISFGMTQAPIQRALRNLGTQALPTARAWAAAPGHPMTWTAYLILADCGDESDLPALLAAWDWLDGRDGDECGYKDLATGIARIGGPMATEAVSRIGRKMLGPHSYERVFHLRALLALDPERSRPLLAEGLWDCESDVRRLAAELAPVHDGLWERLAYLRDDPMEFPEVRTAAGLRCTNRTDGRLDPA